MKKVIWITLFLLPFITIHAQVGFSFSYGQLNHPDWDELVRNNDNTAFDLPNDGPFLNTAWRVIIDYTHKIIKDKRIDFHPELSWSYSDFETINLQTGEPINLALNLLGFHYNTNIYLLDLDGDCDCPTWRKEGPTFKKGFFIQLSPGVNIFNKTIDLEGNNFKENDVVFSLGAGAGMDIGLNEMLTITPFVKANLFLSTDWTDLNTLRIIEIEMEDGQNQTSFNQLSVGIRVGFNFKN